MIFRQIFIVVAFLTFKWLQIHVVTRTMGGGGGASGHHSAVSGMYCRSGKVPPVFYSFTVGGSKFLFSAGLSVL